MGSSGRRHRSSRLLYAVDLDGGSGYCRFDFRTVLADGRDITRYDVNVCAVHTYVIE